MISKKKLKILLGASLSAAKLSMRKTQYDLLTQNKGKIKAQIHSF